LVNVATGVVLVAHEPSVETWKMKAAPSPELALMAPTRAVVPSLESATA
jgi:phosphohistidine phosphatase SixA